MDVDNLLAYLKYPIKDVNFCIMRCVRIEEVFERVFRFMSSALKKIKELYKNKDEQRFLQRVINVIEYNGEETNGKWDMIDEIDGKISSYKAGRVFEIINWEEGDYMIRGVSDELIKNISSVFHTYLYFISLFYNRCKEKLKESIVRNLSKNFHYFYSQYNDDKEILVGVSKDRKRILFVSYEYGRINEIYVYRKKGLIRKKWVETKIDVKVEGSKFKLEREEREN